MAKMQFNRGVLKRAERWIFALVALTILATFVGVVSTSSKSFTEHWATFPWAAVGWLALATVVESVLRFWRYQTTCKALGLPIPFWRLMYYYTVGYALLPTPGKVGTIIRIWLIKVYHNIGYDRTAPLIVMDLISDAIGMLALGALGLLLLDNVTLKAMGWLILAGLVASLVALSVAPWVLEKVIGVLYRAGGRHRARLFARLRKILHNCAGLGGRVLFITVAQSFVGWAIVGIAVGHLVTELGVPFGMVEGTIVITVGTMGGFLSMMPAGVGGAEATMGFLLAQFGVPLATIVIAVALIRLFVLWLSVVIGLICLPFALRNAPVKVEG